MLEGKTLKPTPELHELTDVDFVHLEPMVLQSVDKVRGSLMNHDMVSKHDAIGCEVDSVVVGDFLAIKVLNDFF